MDKVNTAIYDADPDAETDMGAYGTNATDQQPDHAFVDAAAADGFPEGEPDASGLASPTDNGSGDESQDTAMSAPDETGQPLRAALQEAKENYDRLLRVTADFENFKKRSQREMDEFRKYANEALIKQLLPIVDNLERAIASAREVSASQDEWIKGVEITYKEILKVLAGFGVTVFESLNKPFDPAFHQAMMQEENDAVPPGTVVKEYQQGYRLHDRLIRPAMVVVSKPGPGTNAK